MKFLLPLLMLISNVAYSQISVSHDDMFYLAVGKSEITVTVSNDSNQLVVIKNTLHDSLSRPDKNDGENIEYDLSNESMAADIYPRIVPIPPSQTRILTINLANPVSDPEQQDAIYRIRSTPLSSQEIITQQPLLYRLLGKQDRQNIEEMANMRGEMEVVIGAGSILIFQKEWLSDGAVANVDITADGGITITNMSDRVIRLRQVKFYDVDSKAWLYHDGIIIRPNHTKSIAAYTEKNISKMDFVDHIGREHSIRINKS
jgi:hypothetical protein